MFHVRWRYSSVKNITFLHFFSSIISSIRILLCCSTMTILLNLVIISRLRLIIRYIVLSTITIGWTWRFTRVPITFWFPFTKALCLWKFYIYTNRWKSFIDCRTYTNNIIIIIFNRWFFAMMDDLFGRVWYIVKSTFLLLV